MYTELMASIPDVCQFWEPPHFLALYCKPKSAQIHNKIAKVDQNFPIGTQNQSLNSFDLECAT